MGKGLKLGYNAGGFCDVCLQPATVVWLNGPGAVLRGHLHGTRGAALAPVNKLTRMFDPAGYGEIHVSICVRCLKKAMKRVEGQETMNRQGEERLRRPRPSRASNPGPDAVWTEEIEELSF